MKFFLDVERGPRNSRHPDPGILLRDSLFTIESPVDSQE